MYNFKEAEEKILNKEAIKKAVQNDSERKKLFSFLEGPPTANAPPGLHHLEVRTYKDVINKFRYMQGYNVPRKAGWDCHGLPVEVQVEKKLKLNSKKDILKFGEEKFIKECRESVFLFIEAWNKSTEQLNYWIDLDNPYITLKNEYIESVWWSLQQLYKKKLLYEAHKVVHFCPRCQTPLSSHEVAQGYKSVKDDSVIVKFRLEDENAHLLVFTTTPWTLPSNAAIAVNPDLMYSYVEHEGETFIVAKNLVSHFFNDPKIIKTEKGKEFIGKKYNPLFPYYLKENAFRIIGGDFVSAEDGTGLVHMAPAFGEIDYEACKKEGLPFFQPVDENGRFTQEIPEYAGKFIKEADKEIIIRLKKEGLLFKVFPYEHDYPFCWRCDTPLMYYAIKSWFIKVSSYKERLIALNQKINWVPKHIKEGRFGEWLKNVKDWALSRKKFWGTPLPIWRCENNHEEVIGSISELKEKATKEILDKDIDLHKPWIDGVKITCPQCKNEMIRVSDVIDCWYDSGAASFAQFHYPFENKEEFQKRFPYDFIAEAIDQTRGWFYTLHVLATLLFDDIAYKNVICAGHIIDEKGEKMSKSKGNILNAHEVLASVGVDATRLQFCTVDIGASKRFGIDLVKKEIFPFLNVLWNTCQFYNQLDSGKRAEVHIEDRWILSRLNRVIQESTKNLESYYIERSLNPVIEFVVNDFSKTYIKIIRDREDKNAKKVVGEVLKKGVKLLAPYAPHITEAIYQVFEEGSVHLSSWPKSNKKFIDPALEGDFTLALKIIEMGLFARYKEKVSLKQPLSKGIVSSERKLNEELSEIIAHQLNVKKIVWKTGTLQVDLDTRITPELEAEGLAREISRKVQAERKQAQLVKSDRIDLLITASAPLLKKLESQKEFIQKRTNAFSLNFSEKKKEGYLWSSVFELKNESLAIFFKKNL